MVGYATHLLDNVVRVVRGDKTRGAKEVGNIPQQHDIQIDKDAAPKHCQIECMQFVGGGIPVYDRGGVIVPNKGVVPWRSISEGIGDNCDPSSPTRIVLTYRVYEDL